MPSTSRRRFTLIELLVVISIISILMAMLLPALNSARRKVQVVTCANNMKQIYYGVYFYADDNDQLIPCYSNSPNATGLNYSCFIPITAQACGNYAALGLVWLANYYSGAKSLMYCPAEIRWQTQMGYANQWWSPNYGNQSAFGWTASAPGGRWNTTYVYRWAAPNPYGNIVYKGSTLNLQSVGGQQIAMQAMKDSFFADKGFLTENMLSNGMSPANATGTCHTNGGNALYYGGEVKWIEGLGNPYNPGPGPLGYYIGYELFKQYIDNK